jgi:GAF domain-containing protein
LAILKNEALACDDSETDPRVDRSGCRTAGVRSILVVPLPHGGQNLLLRR